MNDDWRMWVEDAVLRALEAGASAEEVISEVDYTIQNADE